MRTRLSRIGNSRGVRLPRELLDQYGLNEGDELEIIRTREGILLAPRPAGTGKLPWATAYEEMAREELEVAEWAEWDGVNGDDD